MIIGIYVGVATVGVFVFWFIYYDEFMARPSLIPSLCTHFTRAGIEWRR